MTRRYTVLIVDDNDDHALLIQLGFARKDPSAMTDSVETAEDAIELLEAGRADADGGPCMLPDAIVLDLDMPGIGGRGFLEWYSRQTGSVRNIPVVICSSSLDARTARACVELGAREAIRKPTDLGELVGAVRRAVEYGPILASHPPLGYRVAQGG